MNNDTQSSPFVSENLYPPPQPAKEHGKGWLKLLPGLVFGGLVGFGMAHFSLRGVEHFSLLVLLGFFAAFAVAIWLQTLIHEAGHALAGMTRGMELMVAGVGPLRLVRGADRWHLQRAGSLQGVAGFAAMYNPDGQPQTITDQVIFILGGPMANLLTAGLAIGALNLVPSANAGLTLWLSCFAGAGVLLGLVNLVPFRTGGWRSDGLNLIDLWRQETATTIALDLGQLVSLSMAGVRPRHWPASLVPTCPDPSIPADYRRMMQFFRMEWALDVGDHDAASHCARELSANLWEFADGQRQGVAVLVALYAAWVVEDCELVEAWIPHMSGGMLNQDCARALLIAETLRLKADHGAMREVLNQAEAALNSVIDQASRDQFRERIDHLAGLVATEPDAVSTSEPKAALDPL